LRVECETSRAVATPIKVRRGKRPVTMREGRERKANHRFVHELPEE
jgi:hypothetical protein